MTDLSKAGRFSLKGLVQSSKKRQRKQQIQFTAFYSVIEQNTLNDKHLKMNGQNDRPDKSLTSQAHDQAGHCPLTAVILSPATRILSSLYIESMRFHEPHIILSTNKLLLIINYIKLVKKQTIKSIILVVTTLRSLYLRSQTLPSK